MPISIEEFEKGTEPSSGKGSSVRPVVEQFLKDNAGSAYTTREIAEATGLNRASVHHTVIKLAEEGLIGRRQVDGLNYNAWIE